MVSTRKKKHQHKRQLSQTDELLYVFVIGNNTKVSTIGDETLELETNGLFLNFGRITLGQNSECQDQVVERNNDVKIRFTVDNAVKSVKNRVPDAIFTAMDNVVLL